MKISPFLVLVVLFAIVFLTGVNIYQNRVIAKQSVEIGWLMAHCGEHALPPASAPR